jgi:hypothetical protein
MAMNIEFLPKKESITALSVGKDGFVFKLLSNETASTLFHHTNEDVFVLHDDGAESKIKSSEELAYAMQEHHQLALGVGFICVTITDEYV